MEWIRSLLLDWGMIGYWTYAKVLELMILFQVPVSKGIRYKVPYKGTRKVRT